MWSFERFAYGIGYERTLIKSKNTLKSFLSWQSSFFVRSDYVRLEFPSSNNQLQTFIKYNFGYKKIIGVGLGFIMESKPFFFNPTGVISYKYDIRKFKTTIGLQIQLSRYQFAPLSKRNVHLFPSSIGPPPSDKFSFHNLSGGICIGKYF